MTRAASSINRRLTAEKPRTVFSLPGMPTRREPLELKRDLIIAIAANGQAKTGDEAFVFAKELAGLALARANDEDHGIRHKEAGVHGLRATMVDLPHWRVQLSSPRVHFEARTWAWRASGLKARISRAKRTESAAQTSFAKLIDGSTSRRVIELCRAEAANFGEGVANGLERVGEAAEDAKMMPRV